MPISLALGIVAIVNLAIGYVLALLIESGRQSPIHELPMSTAMPVENLPPPAVSDTEVSQNNADDLLATAPVADHDHSTDPSDHNVAGEAPSAEAVSSAEDLLASAKALSDEVQQFAKRIDNAIVPEAAGTPAATTTADLEPSSSTPESPPVEPQATLATPAQLETAFHQWREADSESNQPLCVGQIEIDAMPQLTARYDVASIGSMAKQIEQLALGTLRANDLIAPLGRSRFLTIMPDVSGAAAGQLLESLRRRVEQTEFVTEGGPIRATLSASATQARSDESMETLLARSAAALREACKEGRNRVAFDDGETVKMVLRWATGLNR